MSKPLRPDVIVTRLAEMDIADALDWYNARSADLGEAFVRVVTESLLRIEEHPKAAPLVWRERVRQLVMNGFPYCVYYSRRGRRIRVLAVMHQRRDPRDWQVRVK